MDKQTDNTNTTTPLPLEQGSTQHDDRIKESESAVRELTDRGSKKRRRFGLIFLIVNILAIACIAVMEFCREDGGFSTSEVFATWGKNWHYIVIALLCIIVFMSLDSFKQMMILKATTGKYRPRTAAKVAVYGKYYDNITPFACGGQPFQVYLYHKRGIPAGVATSTPIISFFMYQLAFLVVAITVFLTYEGAAVTNPVKITAYAGAVFSMFTPVVLILFSAMPKTFSKLCNAVTRLLMRMKIVKDIDAAKAKIDKFLSEYTESFRLMARHKLMLVGIFLLSIVMQVLYCTIPYYVILACGVEMPWFEVVSMCMFTYCAISFIPTPGNSFAAEGTFYLVFSALKGGFLFWGTMLWRFVSFYLVLLVGIGMITYDYIKSKRRIANG